MMSILGNGVFLLTVLTFFVFAICDTYRNTKKCEINHQRQTVECSHRNLSLIPNSSFPSDTREIDLSSNNITKVTNFTFVDVKQLEILDLSNNRINDLEPMAFVGLQRLLSLNLSHNSFKLIPEIFCPTLFEPLQQLSILSIQEYTPTLEAEWLGIDRGFSMLTNLKKLLIDLPLYFTFGDGFAKLTMLTTISSAGRPRYSGDSCWVYVLRNETFEAFRNISLQELRLPNCEIGHVEAETFLPLLNLTILDLSDNNRLGLKNGLASLYGLQSRYMDEINLRNISDFSFLQFQKYILYDNDMIYLRTICVRFLDLSGNFVVYDAKVRSFGKLECLEHLNVSSGTIRCLYRSTIRDIPISKRLRYSDVNGTLTTGDNINKNDFTLAHPSLYNRPNEQSAVVISAMPSLVTLGASNCFLWGFFVDLLSRAVVNFPKLESFDMSYNNLDMCLVPYDIKTLTELDISGNLCSYLPEYFKYYPLLRKLTFRNSPYLYIAIGDIAGAGDSFGRLLNLKEIDLSGNRLTDLTRNLFINNTNLRTINLSNNKLQRIPSAIMQMGNISRLDLSENAFTHLNPEEMLLLDRFSEAQYEQSDFHLNLRLNPFQCTCETLGFIRWIYGNKHILDLAVNYTCVLTNGSLVDLIDFENELRNLSVRCVSHTWLIIAVVSILFVSLLILLLYVVYRYRINLRYWFYTKLQPPIELLAHQEYHYDAFIAYTEDNYQWVYDELRRVMEGGEEPLRLCFHNRDFTPGKPIHENIVDKMRESMKIILVVSKDFLNSVYGPLEIEYAGMKSLEEGREDLIVCILLEDIPAREMPKALRNLWHKITFLKWPCNTWERMNFWRKLREAITNTRE